MQLNELYSVHQLQQNETTNDDDSFVNKQAQHHIVLNTPTTRFIEFVS